MPSVEAPEATTQATVRPTRAEIDLDGGRGTTSVRCATLVAPAELCAVVKADGYGHGAVAVGRAALAAGADWLAVALVEEAVVLRGPGIDAPDPAAVRATPRRSRRRGALRPARHASTPTTAVDVVAAAAAPERVARCTSRSTPA